MNIQIREYKSKDKNAAMEIWNEVVKDGVAFPQIEGLNKNNADNFFKSQTFTGIAFDQDSNEIVGLYILHPNNVGRCAHIANASYAVKKSVRGEHIGEKLVQNCLKTAHEKGFKILQFNAVVASNIHAIHLYERLGFTKLGKIPAGFLLPNGKYEDIFLFYHEVWFMEKIFEILSSLNINWKIQEHKAIFTVEDGKDLKLNLEGIEVKNLFLKDKKR